MLRLPLRRRYRKAGTGRDQGHILRLLWDPGAVLAAAETSGLHLSLTTACSGFGITVTPEGIAVGYSLADAFMAQEVARLPLRERGRQGVKDFFAAYERLLLQGAGVEVDLETALQISARLRQLPYGFALYEDVLPALGALKGQGLTMGLLSNNEGDMESLCDDLGLSPYLDFAIGSQDVGHTKPHPAIFLEALRRAQVEPGEALHVGDQYETDVKGARAVGIGPVLIDRDGLATKAPDCPRIDGMAQLAELVNVEASREGMELF